MFVKLQGRDGMIKNYEIEYYRDDDGNYMLTDIKETSINFEIGLNNITGKLPGIFIYKLKKMLEEERSLSLVAVYQPSVTPTVKAPPEPKQPYFKKSEIFILSMRPKMSTWDSGYSGYKLILHHNPVADVYNVVFVDPITIEGKYYVDITKKIPEDFLNKLQSDLNQFNRNKGLEPINISQVYMKLKADEDLSKKREVIQSYDLDPNNIPKPYGKRLKVISDKPYLDEPYLDEPYSDGRYNKNKRTLSELYSDLIPVSQAKRFKVNRDGRYLKKMSPRKKSSVKKTPRKRSPVKRTVKKTSRKRSPKKKSY
jgi:hypothetical protein